MYGNNDTNQKVAVLQNLLQEPKSREGRKAGQRTVTIEKNSPVSSEIDDDLSCSEDSYSNKANYDTSDSGYSQEDDSIKLNDFGQKVKLDFSGFNRSRH